MNGSLKPFARAVLMPGETMTTFVDRWVHQGFKPQDAMAAWDKAHSCDIWKNDEYQVAVDQNPHHGFTGMHLWHLSIKRLDREPIHDWRDLQAIKNMIVDPLAEAFELYPSEARLMDGANQYHLYVLMKVGDQIFPTLPVGSSIRAVTSNPGEPGAKQRPLPKEQRA